MPSQVKPLIEAINEASRQLLSLFDIQTKNFEIEKLVLNSAEEDIDDKKILNLVTERQSIITKLFESYTQDELGAELALINEMVLLNKQLTSVSESNKNIISQQVIKLKKSRKVKDLYKKY